MTVRESTTVVIVGGGVAGLTAATLLRKSGVGCVILERQPQAYVERRQPGDWPAERVWEQLRLRLYRPELPGGPITETEAFPLRGLVREPMSYGRLYLLGDAAHVISPMGAKGMNLALYDAEVFAGAVIRAIRDGDETGLREYSDTCLARTWRYQEFAHWMAQTLHEMAGTEIVGTEATGAGAEGIDPFRARLARARFDWIQNAPAGVRWYAEMMTGLG